MVTDSFFRVSAAALCRVIFPHPQTGVMQLALERRNSGPKDSGRVHAQPFGGALRLLDPAGFREAVGDFSYDSVRSSEEQDLRILIPPPAWNTVRSFILAQMQSGQPQVIETDPCRELEEEFSESVGITLLPEQYSYRPVGISVQDRPAPTTNRRLPGASTVRIYRIFEVVIRDHGIHEVLSEKSRRFTDEEMHALAEADSARGGTGRANGVLVLPMDEVRNACQGIHSSEEIHPLLIRGHFLDPTSFVLFEETHKWI